MSGETSSTLKIIISFSIHDTGFHLFCFCCPTPLPSLCTTPHPVTLTGPEGGREELLTPFFPPVTTSVFRVHAFYYPHPLSNFSIFSSCDPISSFSCMKSLRQGFRYLVLRVDSKGDSPLTINVSHYF